MFSVLWRQLWWKWKKSIFLFSSRIQRHQKLYILGLWSWKGAKIPVLLMKSRKDRKSPVLVSCSIKRKDLKCCKLSAKCCVNVTQACWAQLVSARCKSIFWTCQLRIRAGALCHQSLLLKPSALKPLKPICSLGECRNSRTKPFQRSCTRLRRHHFLARYVWLYLWRMRYCAFMI